MKYLSISRQDTLLVAMDCIKKNHQRCVLVTNASGKLEGVISQGDIASALLRGMTPYVPVEKVMNPSFLYLMKDDMAQAYAIFKKYQISLLPVLDNKYMVKSVITLQDVFSYLQERNNG